MKSLGVAAARLVALALLGILACHCASGDADIEGDELPYTPEGLKQKQENQENWLTRDPEIKCYLPGVPRATYMPFPFQITQSAYATFIAYEYAGAVRHIYMKDPGPAQIDSWMGLSHGRWDGDTFVVDVTGLNGLTWLDRAGNYVSSSAHITERYTPLGPNHMQYEATIEDPTVFSRPWTIRMPLYRIVDMPLVRLDPPT